MHDRNLVVVTGSNASPARLVEKLGGDAVVPVLAGTAKGIDVRHSAHVTRYGSVPATAWPVPGASPFLPVLVLDDDQLSELDATEPNYDRLGLDRLGAQLLLLAASALDVHLPPPPTAFAYVSRRGWYRLEGGSPALPPLASPSPGRHGTVVTQAEVLTDVLVLARTARPELHLPDLATLLANLRDPDVDLTPAELTALLAASGRASLDRRTGPSAGQTAQK